MSALARLGHLIRPLNIAPAVVAYPATALAVGALAVCAYAMTRSSLRQLRRYRTAHAQLQDAPTAGDLSVLDRPEADAYALPGNPGRIVVTSGMLRALDGPEREALLAHERAHLAGRHHYFLAAADLATRCHPALRGLCDAIGLAVERVADEAAATAVGDRHLTARAIGRAALAGKTGRVARPAFAAGAAGGPVPQRVKALLQLYSHPSRPGCRGGLPAARLLGRHRRGNHRWARQPAPQRGDRPGRSARRLTAEVKVSSYEVSCKPGMSSPLHCDAHAGR